MRKLIIMRGLPGSGKSTFIQQYVKENDITDPKVCSADEFFLEWDEGRQEHCYRFDPHSIGKAHEYCRKRVIDSMKEGAPVIFVDNTNTQLWEFRSYISLARLAGYKVIVIELVAEGIETLQRMFRRQEHNVPESTFLQMWWRWEPSSSFRGLVDYVETRQVSVSETVKNED